MASRNARTPRKPANKLAKAPNSPRSKKPAAKRATAVGKTAGHKAATTRTTPSAANKSVANKKAAPRRGGAPRVAPAPRGLIALGEVEVFGARYRVFAKPPELVRRELIFAPGDKRDIDVLAGGRIRWSAARAKPFRIQFTGQPPDLDQPRALSFKSDVVSGKQRVEVTLRGHPPGTRLDYDIYSPPDSPKPMDPSLIIYPNAELLLQLV